MSETHDEAAPSEPSLARRAAAEGLGAGLLVCAVVGSGIAAERLSPGQVGLQLLENAVATAAALLAIILVFGPVSGAHVNPAVTLVDRALGRRSNRDVVVYIGAQLVGACLGAVVANMMFGLTAVDAATQERNGGALLLGEVVATFGLVVVIFGMARRGNHRLVPFAVAAYIAGAYWFTSSTSFANPAATIGRMLSDSFAGIAPASVPAFVGAQLIGALIAWMAVVVVFPDEARPITIREQRAEESTS